MKAANLTKPLSLILVVLLTACTSTHTLEKRVSESNYQQVEVSIKAQSEEPVRILEHSASRLFYDEVQGTTPIRVDGESLNVLVLSGGGANGAYGAGVLSGLAASNQLDQYSVVTGISAGALLAPFAFIGESEFERMRTVMLSIEDKQVIGKKNFLNTLFKDAFSKGDKLLEFMQRVYTPEMIERIAQTHQTGRRLLIGTTQFDSEQLVVWNLGQIAASDTPNKVVLIQQILAASASIPGVFPPQFIQVNHQGEVLEELHVDGGLANQMFLLADHIDYQKISRALGLTVAPKVHVIRNGTLAVPYQQVEDKGIQLLARTVQSMTVRQSQGDLYRMAYFSELQGLDLSYTAMDRDFDAQRGSKAMFDAQYMLSLYQYGFLKARRGELWQTLQHNQIAQ
ncbi:patatin-like phospholipase family protein [Vibrio vulnificus]|uniref:patatin-like phospholipase family protein n=1 Tax=Vibrio vulnificus TaxID=672 RepID=UPI001CDC1369|nr:patatin-like phospholipase family protein [Vibrio vulnificus]MCA3908202.1 patatin-like phospholipase family protein [Vibrio vulnificus]